MSKEYDGIHVLKVICAILVVITHIPAKFSLFFSPIIFTAVPCFLIISGFFLFSNNNVLIETQKAKHRFIKIFFLNILVTIPYFIYFYKNMSVICLLRALIFGDGVIYHLWYMCCAWQALLLFYLIRNKISSCGMTAIALSCLAFHFVISKYSFIWDGCDLKFPILLETNSITIGLPCLIFGYLIHKHKILHNKKNICFILLVLSIILSYFEFYIHFTSHNHRSGFMISNILLSFIMMLVAIYPPFKVPTFIVNIGKNHSANIYYFHVLIGMIIAPYCSKSIQAYVVIVLSVLFSIILQPISKKTYFFIKKMFRPAEENN